MNIAFDRRFQDQLRGRIERFQFEVGVLHDRPHMLAGRGLKTLAGKAARKTSRKPSGMTVAEVSKELRANTGVNIYTSAWRKRGKNRELITFMRSFVKMLQFQGVVREKRRIENALQAIVRNPITRGDYGRNSKVTAKIKGFNWWGVDTGQLFRAIKARVRFRRVS